MEAKGAKKDESFPLAGSASTSDVQRAEKEKRVHHRRCLSQMPKGAWEY